MQRADRKKLHVLVPIQLLRRLGALRALRRRGHKSLDVIRKQRFIGQHEEYPKVLQHRALRHLLKMEDSAHR